MGWGSESIEVLGLILSVFYSVWPLVLLIPLPLGGNGNSRRMLRVWMTLAFLRILLLGVLPYTSFQPEPLYSLLFILAGCFLIGLGFARRIKEVRRVRAPSGLAPAEGMNRSS